MQIKEVGSANSIYQSAINYGANFSDKEEKTASITGAEKIAFDAYGYTKYKANFTGTVSKITVSFEDGSVRIINDQADNIKFYKTKKEDGTYANEIKINEIKLKEKYYIYNGTAKAIKTINIEVKKTIDNIYTAKVYTLKSNTGSQVLIAAEHGVTSKTYYDDITVRILDTGKLKIKKHDSVRPEINLSGAQFKIYSNSKNAWVTTNAEGKFEYKAKSTAAEATVFTTNEAGETSLANIKFGIYTIYEIKAPEGYDITKQTGYRADEISSQNNWVCIASNIAIDATNSADMSKPEITYDLYNQKVVNKLEGYVWLDQTNVKVEVTDSIYTAGTLDKRLGGIEVHLCQNGVIVAGGEGHKVYTDSNGHYEFTQKDDGGAINYWDLVNSYVEFIYDNKEYICVEPFAGSDITNNSKAQEYTMTATKLDDNNLTGTGGANPGRATTYRLESPVSAEYILENNERIMVNRSYEELSRTLLTGYYDKNTYTISNINLGLREKYEPSFILSETLAYTKIKINGYTYTYKFGDSPVTVSSNVPKVNEQEGIHEFSTTIYPTDIAYNGEHTGALDVYVVYRIDVINDTAMGDDKDNLYNERKLYLDYLTNTYDTRRYELCTTENTGDSSDFALWRNNSEGKASYDVNNAESVYKNGVESGKTICSYIQFRIKDDALQRILTQGLEGSDREDTATNAEASAYHEYLRTDNLWVHDNNVIAFNGCKGVNEYPRTNAANKKYYVHKSTSQVKSAERLYLMIRLGDPRSITGTVFEDTVTSESTAADEHLGNGIMEDSEKKASKVKVELLDENKNLSQLYQVNDKGQVVYEDEANHKLPDAVTYTDLSNGTFTFTGVSPGYYYIRFTYGDGTQQLIGTDNYITSNNYKSTIINTAENGAGNLIKNAMEGKSENLDQAQAQQMLVEKYYSDFDVTSLDDTEKSKLDEAKRLVEWYKYLDDQNYSTAVDDMTQRQNYAYNENREVEDAEKNVVNYDEYATKSINSYTPMIGISIENDTNNYTDNGDDHKTIFERFDFGVITEPDTDLVLEKKIVNAEFTTQAGSTLVSENPEESKSKYLTALDEIDGGSQYARLEMDPTLIYGSTLETTYQIKITNHTVKDYIEDEESTEYGYYFKYGEITDTADLKEIFVNEVIDQLDEKYDYDSVSSEVEETVEHEDGRTETSKVSITKASASSTSEDGLSMTNWSGIESDASSTIAYSATSLLSDINEDTAYDNKARITSLSLNKLTNLTSNYVWDDISTTTITITPTTGDDRATIYWYIAAGAIGLIILTAGIIIIKKKVLK